MPDINFSCKDCVFAIIGPHDKQNGCRLNRLSKLCNKLDPEEDGFFSFNRFCNTFRPQHWLDQYHQGNMYLAESEVYTEIYPRLTFIIKFNYDINTLIDILNNIENQTINSRKFVIVVNEKVEYNEEVFKAMQSILKKNIGRFNVIQTLDQQDDLDEGFKYAKNGWVVFLNENQTINTNFAEKIHNRINIDMKRFIYSENSDSSKIVVQAAIYKLLNGNRPLVKKDGEVDPRTFKEKLSDMQQTDNDSIIDWEKMFDE